MLKRARRDAEALRQGNERLRADAQSAHDARDAEAHARQEADTRAIRAEPRARQVGACCESLSERILRVHLERDAALSHLAAAGGRDDEEQCARTHPYPESVRAAMQ